MDAGIKVTAGVPDLPQRVQREGFEMSK